MQSRRLGVAGAMSEEISSRLDYTNPREAQALEVLNTWIEKCYSTRFNLKKALPE